MCWPTRVDSYRPPAPRYVKETTRYTRRYSPSPPPVRRIERTYIRRAPSPLPLPLPVPPPLSAPPPPSVYPPSTKPPSKAPTAVPDPPPPPPSAPKSKAPSAAPSAAKSKAPSAAPSEPKSKAPSVAPSAAKSKAPSAAPSAAKSKAPTEAPPPPAPASIAGSKKSRATYVEVTSEGDGASSASSGVMSGAKSNYTHKSSASRRSSAPPPTEYSVHEKEREIRRYVRPVNDWETYRYVDAPPPPPTHSRHRSVSSRRDSGAPGPRDSFDRELKISIRR